MSGSPQTLRDRRLGVAGARRHLRPGSGEPRRAAVTAVTETLLGRLWRRATAGRPTEGLALAATGSLGRGDSGPLGDLDLTLLHDGRIPGRDLAAIADLLWYPLWDSGIGLDHAVRTPAQCRSAATADLTAAVGLLDLRHLQGDRDLVAGARVQLAHDWRADARRRLPELVESVQDRHARFDDLAQSLAPDLKEGRGGLRDLAVRRALAMAWLTERPRGAVITAHATLLDVRDAVQVTTGRPRSRLHREEQDAVAAMLGQEDADALLALVATAGRTVAHDLDAGLRRAGQAQRARGLRLRPRRPLLQPLGHGVHAHDGEVVLGPGVDPAADALLPLRAGVLAARHGLPLAPTTALNLAERCPDLGAPWPPAARELLTDFLAAGPALVRTWEDLDQAGVVSRWLPEWDAVRGRPQHNGIHRHTVDRHCLETAVVAASLGREVTRPDLLVLAALLHDLGKVAGVPDHSVAGERRAGPVLDRWGLPPQERELVLRLVREHLTLADLATSRDPHDPATVDALLAAVAGDRATLDLLRALTEADARAAGPPAWSPWRAALVETLTAAARGRLRGQAPPPPPSPTLTAEERAAVRAGRSLVTSRVVGETTTVRVVSRDREGLFADVAGLLAVHGAQVRAATVATVHGVAVDDWQVTTPGPEGQAPDPAVLRRDLDRLGAGDRAPMGALDRWPRRTRAAGQAVSAVAGQPRVLVVPGAATGATVLQVRAADRPGLVHDLGRALAAEGMAVRSAHVATYAGQAQDSFYVTGPGGGELAPSLVARAVAVLVDACDGLPPVRPASR